MKKKKKKTTKGLLCWFVTLEGSYGPNPTNKVHVTMSMPKAKTPKNKK